MKYLCIDIETGGIGHDKSLLTAYFKIIEQHNDTLIWHDVNDLYLFVKPENDIYNVTAQALEINGINLVQHNKVAQTAKECKASLYHFLRRHSDKNNKLIPLGHGVSFDIKFILESEDKLISKGTWDTFVSYRVLDTATIGQFLKIANKVPTDISGSLSSWAEYFGIDASKAHDAKADVEMSIEVFKKFLDLVK